MTCSTSEVAVCCSSEFAQLVEQPRVLDGDDGLGGEVLDQLDLLVGERANLLAVDGDRADQLVLLEHRHGETVRRRASSTVATTGSRSIVGRLGLMSAMWTTCFVRDNAAKGDVLGSGRTTGSRRAILGICRRRAVQRDGAEAISLAQPYSCRTWPRRCASRSPAWPGTPAPARRRTADDLQHLRGRRLLLQRLGELVACAACTSSNSRTFSIAITAWSAKVRAARSASR